MQRPVVRRVWAGARISAVLVVLTVASACGSTARGEAGGGASVDLYDLANEVTLDALECAHDTGADDAYITESGGIVGGADDPDVVPDCFAKVLERPEYAVFADDSPAGMRSTYDGFVAIAECLSREGYSSGDQELPTFEEWTSAGRTWSPYNDLVRTGDVDRLESASRTCEQN